jgi:hypothetical protein
VGWGVGHRLWPVNLKILPDLGTLRRPIWWVAACGPGFVISPPRDPNPAIPTHTHTAPPGNKNMGVRVKKREGQMIIMMMTIVCHAMHVALVENISSFRFGRCLLPPRLLLPAYP